MKLMIWNEDVKKTSSFSSSFLWINDFSPGSVVFEAWLRRIASKRGTCVTYFQNTLSSEAPPFTKSLKRALKSQIINLQVLFKLGTCIHSPKKTRNFRHKRSKCTEFVWVTPIAILLPRLAVILLTGGSTFRRILYKCGEARARCQAVQQWIKVFHRQPIAHQGTGRGDLAHSTCTVRTQRERCKAMSKYYQHHN